MFKQTLPKCFSISLALLDLAVQIVDGNDGKCHGQALACHLIQSVIDELFHKLAFPPSEAGFGSFGRPLCVSYHSAHTSAEGLLAACVCLGLWIRSRSFEVAAGGLVEFCATFGSQAGALRHRQLLAAANGQGGRFTRHLQTSPFEAFESHSQHGARCDMPLLLLGQ